MRKDGKMDGNIENLVTGSVKKEPGDSGKWRVEYRIKGGKENGSDFKSLKRGFLTKRDATAYLDGLKVTWQEKILRRSDPKHYMTFEELFEMYKTTMDVATKLSTQDSRNNMVYTHILPFFGKMKLADITQVKIEEWRGTFFKNGKCIYKDSYIHAIRSRLCAVLNFATERHLMDFNPAKHVKMGVKEAPERPVWTVEQYKRFHNEISPNTPEYIAFDVFFWCGLRLGELLALTVSDIDLEKRYIRINKNIYERHGKRIVTTPKTAKSIRNVSISETLCNELREYIAKLPDSKPDTTLFSTSKTSLHRKLKAGIEKSGVPRITIHCFRHSHITYLVNKGWSAPVVAARVGHESIYITTHYMHAYSEMEDAVCEMMNKDTA